MTALPGGDLAQISDQLEEIVDLQECFKNMKLGETKSSKAQKLDKESGRSEALKVLFDILVAQLMKQQSFMREMANYVFKQFCEELDEQSLGNLIQIVSTSNEKAAGMLGDDQEDDESEEEEGKDAFGSEVSDDSDDL